MGEGLAAAIHTVHRYRCEGHTGSPPAGQTVVQSDLCLLQSLAASPLGGVQHRQRGGGGEGEGVHHADRSGCLGLLLSCTLDMQ